MTEQDNVFTYTVEVRSFGHPDVAGRSSDITILKTLFVAFGPERCTVRNDKGEVLIMGDVDASDRPASVPWTGSSG